MIFPSVVLNDEERKLLIVQKLFKIVLVLDIYIVTYRIYAFKYICYEDIYLCIHLILYE